MRLLLTPFNIATKAPGEIKVPTPQSGFCLHDRSEQKRPPRPVPPATNDTLSATGVIAASRAHSDEGTATTTSSPTPCASASLKTPQCPLLARTPRRELRASARMRGATTRQKGTAAGPALTGPRGQLRAIAGCALRA